MNYSFRFSSETNKNRLGRARKSFGLARPPMVHSCVLFLCYFVIFDDFFQRNMSYCWMNLCIYKLGTYNQH